MLIARHPSSRSLESFLEDVGKASVKHVCQLFVRFSITAVKNAQSITEIDLLSCDQASKKIGGKPLLIPIKDIKIKAPTPLLAQPTRGC
jgi:hypothetical protein